MSRAVDDLPGYRRRIRIEPHASEHGGTVLAMLEDDMHAMAVTLHHEGGVVTVVEAVMERAPWTTCPGAREQLVKTFAGRPLAEVTAQREKRANCTHLHDLACFAAAHAGEDRPLAYDILVSDPREGERLLELRRDGETMLRWRERDDVIVEPEGAAGLAMANLREWISTLPEDRKEAARALQWAGMVAHGGPIPIETLQEWAPTMAAVCYTFQPERRTIAVHSGNRRDFSDRSGEPLDAAVVESMERLRHE